MGRHAMADVVHRIGVLPVEPFLGTPVPGQALADELLLRRGKHLVCFVGWVQQGQVRPTRVASGREIHSGEGNFGRMEDSALVRARIGMEQYVTHLDAGRHSYLGDEPESMGGSDQGPAPSQFVLSGLAACTVMTLRMYADRKGWPMDGAEIEMWMQTERTDDGWLSLIHARLGLAGPLTTEQRERLLEIARKCPVHRMLTNEVRIHTVLSGADEGSDLPVSSIF
jgi:putative redox protein